MAVISKTNLKEYFNTGDKPTESQFGDLIDSLIVLSSGSTTDNTGSLSIDGNITSSAVISSSKVDGEFSLFAHSASFNYISASTGDFDANTIFIGGTAFSKTDVDAAKNIETNRKSSVGLPMKKVRGFSSASTFIDLEATNKSAGDRIDIKVADTFEALSVSTARTSLGPKETVPLELTGSLKIRPANNLQHEFHGKYQFSGKHAGGNSAVASDPGVVAMEISGSQTLSASNASGTPAANFEIDASNSSQVAGFQIGIDNGSTSIGDDADLLSYYDVSNSMFDTSSAAAGFLAYGALGVQMANNPNVIIENGVVSTNGTISSSMVIGRVAHPANALFENGEVYISQGTIVRVLQGSKFIIQDQQPDITADSDTGTITLSDPTINGGGNVVINPDNGGNPSIIIQSTTIPANQVSYWTVGTNIPGTYTKSGHTNAELTDDTGIQIGAAQSVLYDGIIINGEIITPTTGFEPFNIKLRIEDGAELHIQPVSPITTNDEGDTEVDGNVIIDGNVIEGFSNDVQVTSSLTLSVATHGMGKQVFVRSGSSPLIGIDTDLHITSSHPMYGLPALTAHGYGPGGALLGQTGQYLTTGSQAGVIRLELPSASVGMTFDIKNMQQDFGNYKSPTLLVTPNDSERFILNTNGSSGTNGKGVLIPSGSHFPMQRVHVTCQSGSNWTIINLLGPWQDEA